MAKGPGFKPGLQGATNKLSKAKKTIVAGGSRSEASGHSQLGADAKRMPATPARKARSESKLSAVQTDYRAHKPITRGSMHRGSKRPG